ncbi:MAG: tetratricopeptide repeat protein [Proteobacteria bacterium]|nr:MAG: tetratricopeptide repeat protein [Pseudomonadota bacterium]
MSRYKIIRLSLGALCLAFSLAVQAASWESYMEAGMTAYQQGNYAEAEKQWSAALKKAEDFGPQDRRLAAIRLATSLTNLAELYKTQGKYAEAEPLYQRALAIFENIRAKQAQ